MTFLNPLDALIPKIPFSFFSDFRVWVASEARGSVSGGFWGSCQLSPFWGKGGGSSQGTQSNPPPPQLQARLPLSRRVYLRVVRRCGGGGADARDVRRCHFAEDPESEAGPTPKSGVPGNGDPVTHPMI